MIKYIVSLFAIYLVLSLVSSSNSRLLLQGTIPSVPSPPSVPVEPNQPILPIEPAPSNPGLGSPVNPGQVEPVQPTTPGVGVPANPGTGQPAIPTWTPPPLPPMNSFQVRTTLECTLPNTSPAGCAGRLTSLRNPGENMQVKCSNIGACAASTLTFTYNNAFTERVEMISFSEQYAGYGATVIMDSTASLRKQYIDKFECKAPGACLNTNVKLIGGASLNDVDCPMPHFCQNCNIEICEYSPMEVLLCGTPKPCFGY